MKLQSTIKNPFIFSEYNNYNGYEFILEYDLDMKHSDEELSIKLADVRAIGEITAVMPKMATIGDEYVEVDTEEVTLDLSTFDVEVQGTGSVSEISFDFDHSSIDLHEKTIKIG